MKLIQVFCLALPNKPNVLLSSVDDLRYWSVKGCLKKQESGNLVDPTHGKLAINMVL